MTKHRRQHKKIVTKQFYHNVHYFQLRQYMKNSPYKYLYLDDQHSIVYDSTQNSVDDLNQLKKHYYDNKQLYNCA